MKLSDTCELMNSADYKHRFLAEYYQLEIRISKLSDMLINWNNLTFVPKCSYDFFNGQLKAMEMYMSYLEAREIKEEIEI